jgi:hypothetical protein
VADAPLAPRAAQQLLGLGLAGGRAEKQGVRLGPSVAGSPLVSSGSGMFREQASWVG